MPLSGVSPVFWVFSVNLAFQNVMDTSSIPLDLTGIYDVLKACLLFYAGFWGIPKTISLLKRKFFS